MRETCALLVYDFRASGVVRNALRIAEAGRDAGLQMELWPIRLQGDLADMIPAGISVQPILEGPPRFQRDLDSLRAVPALIRAIDRRNPRLLLSVGNHTHIHAALAMLLAADRDTLCFVGRASNAVISGRKGWAPWRALAAPFEHFQYKSMDRIVAVSSELEEAIGNTFNVDSEQLLTIPNGVDLAAIEAAARVPISHPFFGEGMPPVIVGIGRLSRQKNFEGLVRAFAMLKERRAARLLILGSGSERRTRNLRALAVRLGVGEDVDLAGFAPNPAAYLSRASLFALSSRWEGASNVLLEAMACGCPVVATRAPTGVAEVLLGGRIGPLVPVGDDHALADAMLARLEQPRNAATLRAHAAEFDLGATLQAYVRVLKRSCR